MVGVNDAGSLKLISYFQNSNIYVLSLQYTQNKTTLPYKKYIIYKTQYKRY